MMWWTQCWVCGEDICIGKHDDPICCECEDKEMERAKEQGQAAKEQGE